MATFPVAVKLLLAMSALVAHHSSETSTLISDTLFPLEDFTRFRLRAAHWMDSMVRRKLKTTNSINTVVKMTLIDV